MRKTEKLRQQGKAVSLTQREDEDARIHELAASLGFKRHHYQVHWFRDENWLASQMEQKAARDAEAAEKARRRDEQKAAAKAEKALLGGGNRVRARASRARSRSDLPQGRILWDGGKNPKKEGTSAHARWTKLIGFDRKTVEAYLFDGGNPTTLANAIKKGRVKVVSDAEIEATRRPAEPPAKSERAKPAPSADGAGGGGRASRGKGKSAGGGQETAARPAKREAGQKQRATDRVPRRGLRKGVKS